MELNNIFDNVRLTKKQKELLTFHFLSLKETYFLKGEKIFKKKAIQLFELIDQKNVNISTVCDVGAGSGIFIEEMKKIRNDISYFAIEPGDVSSKIISSKGIPVLQKSVEHSEEWSGKFDFVVSLEVLEHVNRPIDFVKALNNLLKEDGYC